MERAAYHIFVKSGDATAELERVLHELGPESLASKGLHKSLYVTRADQTVAFLLDPDCPAAHALRGRPGWSEPGA